MSPTLGPFTAEAVSDSEIGSEMHEFPTVDDLLARCSPITALPPEVDIELGAVIARIDGAGTGDREQPLGLQALDRKRESVMLYFVRRIERFEDGAPRFVSTARRVARGIAAPHRDAQGGTAYVFREARSALRERSDTSVEGQSFALRRVLRAIPPADATKDPDAAELDWHIRQLISYADPVDAEIVRLVAWERLGLDVAARIVRLRESQATSRFHRARSVLAEQLRDSGDLGPSR